MKDKPAKSTSAKKQSPKPGYPPHNHLDCWDDAGDYERMAVKMAVERLLKGRHFARAANIGGHRHLGALLAGHVDKLVSPKAGLQQLLPIRDLKLKAGSVDLVTFVRVMNHLPNPEAELDEVARVLSKDGCAIIEVANHLQAWSRLRHLLKGKRMSSTPVDARLRGRTNGIAFVNHNPHTVIKQLAHAGLKVERILSVANLSGTGLDKIMPKRVTLAIEGILQPTLASAFCGPSVFFLVKKA